MQASSPRPYTWPARWARWTWPARSGPERRRLIAACQIARGGGGPVLVTGAEKRRTKAASPLELTTGDAAAALLVGEGRRRGEAARPRHPFSTDFVDHYRGQDERFDYVWEERWVRDEGFLKIVPRGGRPLRLPRPASTPARSITSAFASPDAPGRFASVVKKLGLAEGQPARRPPGEVRRGRGCSSRS